MHVIGTAGHVDHGKSTLVKALTGIDPDRLKEEKEREMTIDLGFAWLTLPNGESVGIVDVPGHKDFIKNMLAGVGGIDAAILVIAADEGVMPQTREHLDILDLLQVRNGIVALTKKDLVEDPEWLELVMADVAETLAGTVLEGAPVVPVSARTREGIPELLAGLERILSEIPPRPDRGRPRLPVDRVFSIAGFGTVVTGTLIDGSLRVGQEVEIQPQGLTARIRGLQTHKQKVDVAMPGSRVAVNLTGVNTDQVQRGNVVTAPGWLHPTLLADVRLKSLDDAPRALKHGQEVEFFCGSAEVMARVRLLEEDALAPGREGWAQLALSDPVPLVRGDRFVIRQPSPSLTIGGGVIVNPHPGRKYRRKQAAVIAQLETAAHGTPEEIVLQALESPPPQEVAEVIRKSGLPRESVSEALARLVEQGQAVALGDKALGDQTFVTTPGAWHALVGQLTDLLAAYHGQYPARLGMPKEEVKSRLKLPPRLFAEVVQRAAGEGAIADDETTLRLPSHRPHFRPDEQAKVDALLAAFRRSPYATPSVSECEQAVGAEAFNALVEQGRLVKVSADVVFLAETYQEMVDRVVRFIQEHGSITVAQVRDMFNASRKYALALMEHLDQRKVTRRVGDERVLR
ncbi:MAG: selenocysteine-specific translation elongation factor [Anaerolineae bacterium]|nr:selenocysteine-specific translation elongation factor [Anaerolineae bacterium]